MREKETLATKGQAEEACGRAMHKKRLKKKKRLGY